MLTRQTRMALLYCVTGIMLAASSLPAQQSGAHDQQSGHHTKVPLGATLPLYENLGSLHLEIATADPLAQRYFDQGLRLTYGFNHAEAIESYKQAARLDSTCAMCYWGLAWASGPNINAQMDSAAGVAAYEAIQLAIRFIDRAKPEHQAMIRALAKRYDSNPTTDRKALDSTYARAMADVAARYPNMAEAQVLYGESIMVLSPWNYWTDDKQPRQETEGLLRRLESVIERDPNHPGACHFFIHAVEAAHPERAVECAERLAALMPGVGHLVHMPGHIYIRVGRYVDAVRANEHAVHADESWIQDRRPGVSVYTAGYYPHNYDFLAFAASMAGRSVQAIEAADKVAALVPAEMLRAPGLTFLQHYITRPLQIRIRFGKWQEILDTPAPPAELPHARAMWHYARGRAYAATNGVSKAEAELARVQAAVNDPRLQDLSLEFNKVTDVLGIAEDVLMAHIAAARGDMDASIAHLRSAARREDGLVYGEPPEWSVPVRHDLGAMLLAAGRAAQAEAVYREDLERFPRNGWSLFGLRQSLEAQGLRTEAAQVGREFETAWEWADVRLTASRF